MKYILGLDLGTHSAGWAILELDSAGKAAAVKDAGVRIFEAPVEPKTQAPKNLARRTARQHRRQLARRKQRRVKLTRVLQEAKLLPVNQVELETLLLDDNECNPYMLRAKGLDSELGGYEFGRVLFHINQRRGFKSNRKTSFSEVLKKVPAIAELIEQEESAESTKILQKQNKLSAATTGDDDDGVVKAGISLLRATIETSNARTLGEYLYLVKEGRASRPNRMSIEVPKKVRGLYTERAMYEDEFEQLWAKQSQYNQSLDAQLKVLVFDAIFSQRPLKTQKYLVGDCVFEYHRKRAAKATLEFQRFRFLQTVNDLEIKNTDTRLYRKPTEQQRLNLLALLEKSEKVTWGRVRKALQIHSDETINFEEGGKEELLGDSTSSRIGKAISAQWEALSVEKRNELVADLLTIPQKDWLLVRLLDHWKFSPVEAYKLAILTLEPGYGAVSMKALRKLIPLMGGGLNYKTACDKLSYIEGANRKSTAGEVLPFPPNVRNPVVQKALYQVRRLLHAIVRKYGVPEIVTVELARDMKLSKKQKEESEARNRKNKRERDIARAALQSNGLPEPSHDDLLKYRLWKEAGCMCPYTGQLISMGMLLGKEGEVDIEHIIPYGRCLDDSYMNKTICLASENRAGKREKTPYEAYSINKERYEDLLSRVSHMSEMPFGKKRRFELRPEDISLDEFVTRQLNDTRYICREVSNYLLGLGCRVQVSKGEATSALRHKWALNEILSPDGSGEKNRADHRHHAIDAIVVALTTPTLFRQLSNLSAQTGFGIKNRRFLLEEPWRNFHKSVEDLVEAIVVSHEAHRKITGKLHEDSAYGPTEKEGQFVRRRSIEDLTAKDLPDVRDGAVKAILTQQLERFNGSAEKAFSMPVSHNNPSILIKKVRLNVRLNPEIVFPISRGGGTPFKYHNLGNNHHVEVIQDNASKKFEFEIVSAAEAARRVRREGSPVVKTDFGPAKKFVMSLCANDTVELSGKDGVRRVFRVKSFAKERDRRRIVLQLHNSASPTDFERLPPNGFQERKPRKLEVDMLGRIIDSRMNDKSNN